MLRKLQHKVAPQEKNPAERPPGKDYILIFLIMLSILVIGASWEIFDTVMLSMYILLTISLILTYTRRTQRHRLSEVQRCSSRAAASSPSAWPPPSFSSTPTVATSRRKIKIIR